VLTPLGDKDPRQIGPYRIQGLLGRGGMGAVYLGFSPGDKAVAVKVPMPALARDEQFRARFRREVDAARRVRGRAVAAVLDADTDSDRPWMATEYVDGKSLAEAVSERGRLDERLATGLAMGLAEALIAIHAAGVVHRDLKPGNIVLAWDGPRVIDFGVASATGSARHTSTGMLIGTVVWMAPEQLRGERAGPPADIFAWGACVAFAATGQSPFRAPTPEAVGVRILREPPELTGVPAALVPTVRAALDKDPARRPTAAELLDRLLRGGAVDDVLGATTTVAETQAAGADAYQTALAQLWDLPGGTPAPAGARRGGTTPPPGPRTPMPARPGPGPRPASGGYGAPGGGYADSGPGGSGYRDSGYGGSGPGGSAYRDSGYDGSGYGGDGFGTASRPDARYRDGGYPAGGTATGRRTPPPAPPGRQRRPLTTVLLALGFVLLLGGAAAAALVLARGGGTPSSTASTGTASGQASGRATGPSGSSAGTRPGTSAPPKPCPTSKTDQTTPLAAAQVRACVESLGFTPAMDTFDATRALNVVVGSRSVHSDHPGSATATTTGSGADTTTEEQAFVFSATRWYLGTDYRAPSRHVTVVDQTNDTSVLRYTLYHPSDPDCCSSAGAVDITFHWDGSHFTSQDSPPPADPNADDSRR
jgi:predicted Ser/Thr protein kinase